MDVYHQNAVVVPGGQVAAGFQPEIAPFPASSSLPADFFPGENEEGSDDANLQWLSMFMEDCLSPTPSYTTTTTTTTTTNQPPRAKRTKLNPRTEPKDLGSDPVLVHQTHWLAESELLFPVSNGHGDKKIGEVEDGEKRVKRCSHCHSHKTPQWRAGPMGPKTLCNACGVRFKSGRLLPEYRPAKSPTFVSYKHSNSHKKVMEMRMMAPPASSSSSIIHNN